MPDPIAFGTWKLPPDDETARVILAACQAGYRRFDTAYAYTNEPFVGDGLKQSGIAREQLFISGKLWNSKRQFAAAQKACRKSLKNLQIEFFDQFLLHWPASPAVHTNWRDITAEAWRALEKLKEDGVVRTIGVCNFKVHHLEALMDMAQIAPEINQIELHPGWLPQKEIDFCNKHGIQIEAWSPLGNGLLLTNPELQQIAQAHSKTPAQVCLRWCMQHNVIPITKTTHPDHMKSNLKIDDFCLTNTEMQCIDAMPVCAFSGLDPDTITQFG